MGPRVPRDKAPAARGPALARRCAQL